MAELTWLHLSDWHQQGPDFDREVVRNALVKDISDRARIDERLGQVDLIVFSGDLAFNGRPEEYDAAQKHLIEPVLRATGLKRKYLFFVPGNHDLSRDTVDEMLPPDLQKPMDSDALVQTWLTDDKKRARTLEPFEAYRAFVTRFTGQSSPDYASVFHLRDKHVALLGLNSAWMCARHKNGDDVVNDYGFALVGEPQVEDGLKKIAGAELRIAVLHHPFEWLAEFDRYRMKSELRKQCSFILSGHEHCPEIEITHGTSGTCVIIPAGSSYDRRIAPHPRQTNAYNFVHLDLANRRGVIYLRRWNDTKKEWLTDNDLYPRGQYKFRFSL